MLAWLTVWARLNAKVNLIKCIYFWDFGKFYEVFIMLLFWLFRIFCDLVRKKEFRVKFWKVWNFFKTQQSSTEYNRGHTEHHSSDQNAQMKRNPFSSCSQVIILGFWIYFKTKQSCAPVQEGVELEKADFSALKWSKIWSLCVFSVFVFFCLPN